MKDILNAINSAIIAPTRNIGLGSKSYGFMEKMLHSSIGSSLFSFDSYGSIIGTRANPYMNSETDPWFMLDKERQKYSDYLSYINNTYFYGTMAPPNFGKTGNMLSMLEYSALLQENSYVGALHHFDMDNIMGANLLIPNGATNPNGYDDTRLGVINNYYLSNTLYNSLNAALNRSYSSYYTKTIKSEIENDSESFSVTKGAYSSFGLMGPYGIKNGTFSARDGMVASNSQYIGNILTDYEVSFGKKSAFNERDEVLIDASGDKTREFIAKSMYGFDLLDNIDDIASFLEGNVNNINERSNKKYFPTKSGGYDYISSMCDSWDVSYLWRYKLTNLGNDAFINDTFYEYEEKNVTLLDNKNGNSGVRVGKYEIYDDSKLAKQDLLSFTNEQFKKGRFDTIIGRLSTEQGDGKQYGMSRGRNLLKKNHASSKNDPYCRAWTYHKQYSKTSDLIRPFIGNSKEALNEKLKIYSQKQRQHLVDNGVMENGFVRFVPSKDDKYKKCMFSIENLAWKGSNLLKPYEKGPNGGRIMWFPPYGLTFNENIKTNWNPTQFIGRGEKIYSYVDTERGGNLSFQLLIDHPSILNSMHGLSDTDGDKVESNEQAILRFFAGCDILGDTIRKKEGKQKNTASETSNTITNSVGDKTIKFSVYFPNNFSGIDYDPTSVINYLISGLGGHMTIPHDGEYFIFNGKSIGGYEQQNDLCCGLSVVESWSNVKDKEILCYVTSNLSGYSAPIYTKKVSISGVNYYWGYLVDDAYQKQKLQENENYLDTVSFSLNCSSQDSTDNELWLSFNDFAKYLGISHSEVKVNNDKVKIIGEMLKNCNKTTIQLIGYSTNDGDKQANTTIAKNRAQTIKKWLEANKSKFNNVTFEEIKTHANQPSLQDVNNQADKMNRRVDVIITCHSETMEDASNSDAIPNGENIRDNVNVSDLQVSQSSTNGNVPINQDESQDDSAGGEQSSEKVYNEYDFFTHIADNVPLMRHRILEKIKYFDPAYHSITPEGFNNRLTFLHQCTRQGATNSTSDNNRNVRNLSFGAPPICVLKIGDFYNTKIIIESITIGYDEAEWDLNDEGVGVMPMMAKIDITFHFIGGSDLGGPIAKLQNAVSFNYYANTHVYDDNADKTEQTP